MNECSFNSSDPFPLVEIEQISGANLREHSRAADTWLGFEIQKSEQLVLAQKYSEKLKSHETWVHLDVQIFSTPYLELRLILDLLNPQPGSLIADLGCGYCRLAFIIEEFYPLVKFVGLDCVGPRIVEAQRVFDIHKLENSQAHCADLLDLNQPLPKADCFFMYDFGSIEDVAQLLERLRIYRELTRKPFKLVGRGRRTLDCIESKHRGWLFKESPLWSNGEFAIFGS